MLRFSLFLIKDLILEDLNFCFVANLCIVV